MLGNNIIFKQKYKGCIQNGLRNSPKTFGSKKSHLDTRDLFPTECWHKIQ